MFFHQPPVPTGHRVWPSSYPAPYPKLLQPFHLQLPFLMNLVILVTHPFVYPLPSCSPGRLSPAPHPQLLAGPAQGYVQSGCSQMSQPEYIYIYKFSSPPCLGTVILFLFIFIPSPTHACTLSLTLSRQCLLYSRLALNLLQNPIRLVLNSWTSFILSVSARIRSLCFHT